MKEPGPSDARSTEREARSGSRATAVVAPLLVALITVVAFAPALQNGFVAWDDDKNFLSNPHYRGLGWTHLRWMWTTFHLGHYVPLSWMTLGLDYVLWGMNPLGYHLTNVVLHAANAVLLYWLARRLLSLADVSSASATWAAAFAALVFAVHPLRVESVAWVTERRDVLSGFFCLSSVLLYLRAVDDRERQRRWYTLSVLTFVCALLAKATSVTVPVVLLILNVYPLRRLDPSRLRQPWTAIRSRPFVELIPFAVLSLATAMLSIVALHPPSQLGPLEKVTVSAFSLAFYLWRTLVPVGLSPVYEMPQRVDPLEARFLWSYAVVAIAAIGVWRSRGRWPGITAAAVAFLVIVFPLLGIVQNGPQIAADRYTYHAAPALAILAGAALARASLRVTAIVATTVVLALSALTWKQTLVWRDTKTLWSRVLDVDDRSSVGHVGMANVFFKQNRVDEALTHARRAVEIAPTYAQARNDLGVGLARTGQVEAAVEEYRLALALEPTNDEARSNLGGVLASQGDLEGAIEQYRLALAVNPDNADAHVNWGNALVRLQRHDEAIEHYRVALVIRPDAADAEHNWGVALAQQRRLGEAIEHFQRALAIDPAHAEARAYLDLATRLLRGGG